MDFCQIGPTHLQSTNVNVMASLVERLLNGRVHLGSGESSRGIRSKGTVETVANGAVSVSMWRVVAGFACSLGGDF